MLKNKIFVTSHPNKSTLQFVIDLFRTSNREFLQTLVDDRLKETKGDVVGVCIPYAIKTKYYSANVDFWLDEIDPSPDTVKAYCEKDSDVSKVVDAFIYLFDKNKPNTFDAVKRWKPFIEQAEPNVRIVLGTTSKKPLTEEMEHTIYDWCASNNFMYVDMDETSEMPMDKVGMDLILATLENNMWDGMIKEKENNKKDELKIMNDLDDDLLDLPTQDEIESLRKELFGNIDEEDGLDKVFETIQSMREHGKSLSMEERRKMAAKVAFSFAAQFDL
ncbi:uncharacterized protein BX663DRAFT_527867 [Cokeromyces recurvatus]|uniref:uncharacterized protein n=1 Tax=Cokeromyces recurvatus TaxID=90255 RepID=UPI00221FB38F|nr:uncharacterized protein BX663DRAFT_527867 [Cokeromyces recurvatus]KAI7897574.1 hypothetical protein BX663DRAFT_527867 [Cokeromyces recurvatus]